MVREFRPDDWARVWPIVEGILVAGETYCWPSDATESEARTWWMHGPHGRVFVAEDDDGRIVGTAEMHPNQAGGGSHVANAGFMVAPHASGRGVGRALATRVLETARSEGFRAMQFNAVVETNVGAVHLWESLGFRVMTTIPGAFKHPTKGYVGLLVMFQELV
jgi:GNAT superfamily N-acetyltransferase